MIIQKISWWYADHKRKTAELIRSIIPPWSTLRTLGSSKLVGATMLIPFLGTLLLFNHAVLEALRIPEELMRAWDVDLSVSTQHISLLRLKLTYFGLCFIGIASFLFTLICPAVIRRYASAAEYVRGDDPLFTGSQIEEATGTTIANFMLRTRETEYTREATFSCPPALLQQTHIFLREISTIMLKQREEEEQNFLEQNPGVDLQVSEKLEETDEERAERYEEEERHFLWDRYTPGADVNKIVSLIYSGNRADQSMYHTLSSIGRDFPADAMSLSYLWQDHSRPFMRFVISFIFLVGFSLLSVPTIYTFLTVLRQTLPL